MTATEPIPLPGDLDFVRALIDHPTLLADEAARFAGVPLPDAATDDDPDEGGGDA